MTSFGELSSLPPYWEAITSRLASVPSAFSRARTIVLVECSQTSRLPSASSVMPLHLFAGLLTSTTPPSGLHLRRTSPGMSLKRREPPPLTQIGPSVKVKPVATRSASVPSSRRSQMAADLACTPMGVRSFLRLWRSGPKLADLRMRGGGPLTAALSAGSDRRGNERRMDDRHAERLERLVEHVLELRGREEPHDFERRVAGVADAVGHELGDGRGRGCLDRG